MKRLRKYLYSAKKFAKSKLIRDTRKRVNLFIVGEQKCGTTSLFKLLSQHELVLGAKNKECHYFNSIKYEQDKGFKNYHHSFRHYINRKYTYLLDASPDYLGDELAYKKVHEYNPEAKIIIMLRDPVQRFISAYNFYFSNIVEELDLNYERFFQYNKTGKAVYDYLKKNGNITIEDFLEDEMKGASPIGALRKGHYFPNIDKWERTFSEKNICLLSFEALINPLIQEKEIEKLENFLSLKSNKNFLKYNSSLRKSDVSAETIKQLEFIYSNELFRMNLNDKKK